MVVGTIIGSSIFVQTTDVTRLVPSVKGILFVWIAAGVLTLFGSLVCAELASIFPQAGGVYVYLKEAYSPVIGFLWVWAMFWVMHSGIIAAMSVICARYVAYFYPMSQNGIKLVAVGCILILSAVNYFGVKQGSGLQTLITAGKILAILILVVLGFLWGSRVNAQSIPSQSVQTTVSLKGFLLAMIAGLFTYGGWHMVSYNAEETLEPRKTIPRALIIGTLVVMACYVAVNAMYLYILPLPKVISSSRLAADAADAVAGFGGGALLSALVVISTFGAVSGIILAGPRAYYSMARDGLLFAWIGKIHPRCRTPHYAIILQAIWSSVLVCTETYQKLFTRVIYTEWIFFGLMAVGLFILRRRKDIRRDYAITGYPVVPALFVCASFVIVMDQLILNPRESAVGISFVLTGLPVYFLWNRWKKSLQGSAEPMGTR